MRSKALFFLIVVVSINFGFFTIFLFDRERSKATWLTISNKTGCHLPGFGQPSKSGSDITNARIVLRTRKIKEACQEKNDTKPLNFKSLKSLEWPWIYVSHKKKVLYCQTPKVGSSGWMKVIGAMEGRYNGTNDTRPIHNIPLLLLSYLNVTQRNRVLRDYTKLMMIREPFDRAVSAYRDKFLLRGRPWPDFAKLARNIVKHYRSSDVTSKQSDASEYFSTKSPTFDEFIAYVTDPNNDVIDAHYSEPRHWQPQVETCYPCNIDYDYVIDIAHVDAESEVVLQSMGIPPNIRYPQNSKHKLKSSAGQRYSDVTLKYLTKANPSLINSLYHYYKQDYETLGFETPPQF